MNLLTSLRYLVALSDHRHFARAAQACHITQPALSNAVRSLEKEFGAVIVRKGRTFAGLTPEGERILLSARRMLHEQDQLKNDLRGREDAPTGQLRLGAVPTAVPVAARFAAALRSRHAGITVTLRSLSSPQLDAGLRDLTLDLALGFTERITGRQRLVVLAQYEERYFFLRKGRPGGGLRVLAPCDWKLAARQPLCLLTPEMHNRAIVDDAFAQAGVEVQPVLETNSVSTLVLSVAAGGICSVVPGAVAATAPAGVGLEAHPLVRPSIGTPVGFLTREEPAHGALQAALDLARSQAWLAEVQNTTGRLGAFKP